MIAVSEFKKGAVGNLHNHPHRQITYITRGKFEVQIENVKKILMEGDSFLIDPALSHGVLALEDSVLVDVFAPYREDFLK
jgi:quercetin dioxygenase-like cupin family protein